MVGESERRSPQTCSRCCGCSSRFALQPSSMSEPCSAYSVVSLPRRCRGVCLAGRVSLWLSVASALPRVSGIRRLALTSQTSCIRSEVTCRLGPSRSGSRGWHSGFSSVPPYYSSGRIPVAKRGHSFSRAGFSACGRTPSSRSHSHGTVRIAKACRFTAGGGQAIRLVPKFSLAVLS